MPRRKGGTDTPTNLAPACRGCNRAKGIRKVEDFLRDYPEVLARVRRHQAGEDALSGIEPAERPVDRRKTTTIRIPGAVLDALKQLAFDRKTTVNDLLTSGVSRVLNMHGRAPHSPTRSHP